VNTVLTRDTATAPEPRSLSRLIELSTRAALILGLAVLVVYFSLGSELFLTMGNFRTIALSSAILLIVAVPQAILVIQGYVDLSVGSIVGLSGVITGLLIVDHGVAWWIAVLAGVGIGVVAGALNGLLVAVTALSPIIVTLGTLQAYRGITQALKDGPPAGFGMDMQLLGRGVLGGVPVPVWIALLVFAVGAVFLYRTPSGRYSYAIGVNKEAAFLSGIPTRTLPLLTYAASGAAAGIGGVLLAARLDSAPPSTLGAGFELDVLTAVLLGGVAFSGGRGTVVGVLVGVAFLGVLRNGMTLMNVPYFTQAIATGAALIVGASLDHLSRRSRSRTLVRKRSVADVSRPTDPR
jgi:ribose transport system permease protein